MCFEDYLEREYEMSFYQESINKRKQEKRKFTREERRIKSRNTMTVIAGVCIVLLILLLCIGFLTQNKQEELDDNLPTEVITVEMPEEILLQYIEEREELENEKIQAALIAKANRIDDVVVSHYCAEKYHHICNAGDPYKTALGHDVIPGLTCAVDPNMIPLGSTVFVDYGDGVIYEYFASDTGGAIKDKRLDVAVDTHEYALQCGLKNATVWWIKE